VGFLVLPFCAAVTMTFVSLVHEFPWTVGLFSMSPALLFTAGFAAGLIAFLAMPPPVRVYVIGHELTHVLWAWLFGAKVSGLRLGAGGGSVKVSKTNPLIVLAPYFFPFYTVLVALLLGLLAVWWPVERFAVVFHFLLGLTFSFHLTMTIMTLAQKQSDITSQGRVFSAVTIYFMNVLVLCMVLVGASPRVTLKTFAERFSKNTSRTFHVINLLSDKVLQGLYRSARR